MLDSSTIARRQGADSLAHYEMASASLLSHAPALAKQKWYEDSKGWEEVRLQLEQRLYGLRQYRYSWWQHWALLAESILPRRYHYLIVPNTTSRGAAINQAIKDPTGSQAVGVCVAGMRSGLMSSSRPWFKTKPSLRNFKPDREAELWFEDTDDRIYRVFSGSNYYNAGTQMFEDLIVFGTAPKIMYEDRQTVINCLNPCAGEYYLGVGPDLRIHSFYRLFVQTVIQCVQMFGLENCSQQVQSLWELKGAALETEIIVAHVIEPNFSLQMPGMQPKLGVVPGNFTYREYYWEWGKYSAQPMSVRGFRTKPFIAPRWSITSNDAYGRSPGMDALPDILQLHTMTMRQAEAIEKMLRPPMLADVMLKNQPSSILPGKVTYVADISKGMKSIFDVRFDVEHMTQLIEKIEGRVQKWFFNDAFQMMENLEGVQPRNELEIAERRGEKLQRLGPVVENVEAELADDIRRVTSIMNRRGLLRPLPASLRDIPLEIEFDSMIRVAQRAAKTATMERAMTVVMNVDKAYPDEHVGDVVKKDKWAREYLDLSAFPVDCVASEEEVQQIRQGRAQAMAKAAQQTQQAQALTHTAPAVAGAAKTASEIDTGGALAALNVMGGIAGNAGLTQ
jgi:Bacteriophage head to tail connecting protein